MVIGHVLNSLVDHVHLGIEQVKRTSSLIYFPEYCKMTANKNDYIWPTFNQHISETLRQMMINHEFTDVTLICEDQKQVSAHKNILSACSPVLRNIFKMNTMQSPLIFLRGIQSSEIEAMLNFIYLGEATCPSNRKIEFLNVARSFEIQGLARLILDMDEDDEEEPKPPLNEDFTPTQMDEDSMELKVHPDHEEEEDEEVIDEQELNELMGNSIEKDTDGNKKEDSKKDNPNIKTSKKNIKKVKQIKEADHPFPELANMELDAERTMLKCLNCPSEFSTQSGLLVHIKAKHSDGKRFKCDQCDEEYVYQTDLTRHQSKHNSEKMVRCDFEQCQYQSNRPDKVKLHRQTIHQGIKFPCNHCEYKAMSPCDLRKHVRGRHEGIRYTCDRCDHISVDKSSLKKHILAIHEGVRYSCDQCERSFTLRSSLSAHKKKKHILLFKNFE